ncbi:MAG: acyltransferase family protein [Vulcanimicrobiota bacterium]
MKGAYVPAYDGLRFLLLLGVLQFHYLYRRADIAHFWFLSYSLCCFFVLSGFLITHLLLASEARPAARLPQVLLGFYIRRGLRVFPAYYVVLAAAAATLGVPYLLWQIGYLLNIKLFLLSLEPIQVELNRYMASWETNGAHLWSMGVEEQFYLLYPPLLLLTPGRWRTLALSLGIGGCIAIRVWLTLRFPLSFYGTLLPVPGEYVLWGCLMAWLEFRGQTGWLTAPAAFRLAGLGLLALFVLDHDVQRYLYAQWRPPLHQTAYAVLLAVWVLALKYQPRSWICRLLSWPPVARLGKISYGTYLVHLFLNPALDRLLSLCPWLALFPQAPRAIAGPLLSLAVAGAMWISFEGRANQAKDRWAPQA